METLIQNIPVAAALVLPVVLVLMVVTNIIVEVLKKLTWGKLPTNLRAFAGLLPGDFCVLAQSIVSRKLSFLVLVLWQCGHL